VWGHPDGAEKLVGLSPIFLLLRSAYTLFFFFFFSPLLGWLSPRDFAPDSHLVHVHDVADVHTPIVPKHSTSAERLDLHRPEASSPRYTSSVGACPGLHRTARPGISWACTRRLGSCPGVARPGRHRNRAPRQENGPPEGGPLGSPAGPAGKLSFGERRRRRRRPLSSWVFVWSPGPGWRCSRSRDRGSPRTILLSARELAFLATVRAGVRGRLGPPPLPVVSPPAVTATARFRCPKTRWEPSDQVPGSSSPGCSGKFAREVGPVCVDNTPAAGGTYLKHVWPNGAWRHPRPRLR